MSTLTQVRHLKARESQCGITLEPCEDRGCGVDADGHADCGRLACPNCGFSGANLSTPQLASGDELGPVSCDCGHIWVAGSLIATS
jgi:DNA-directed RNA polymerase subunit M/transcription elongation factor TFIIS